jgi:hypothetical protein
MRFAGRVAELGSLGGIIHFAVSKTKDKAEKGNIMNFQPIHLNILSRFGKLVISAVTLGAAAGAILVAQESRSIDEVIVGKKNGSEQDRAGIERLHQQDAAATLSDKADELDRFNNLRAVRENAFRIGQERFPFLCQAGTARRRSGERNFALPPEMAERYLVRSMSRALEVAI